MADYIDTIRIGDNPNNEKPIWDTAITINGASPDNDHHVIVPTQEKPTSGSSQLLSSGTLHDLLINTTEVAEYTVTLPTSGWSSNSITITSRVEGNEFLDSSIITKDSVIIVSPSPTSSENIANYGKASIYCSSSGTKSLTFSRASANSSDISVNVLVMNIRTSF